MEADQVLHFAASSAQRTSRISLLGTSHWTPLFFLPGLGRATISRQVSSYEAGALELPSNDILGCIAEIRGNRLLSALQEAGYMCSPKRTM